MHEHSSVVKVTLCTPLCTQYGDRYTSTHCAEYNARGVLEGRALLAGHHTVWNEVQTAQQKRDGYFNPAKVISVAAE